MEESKYSERFGRFGRLPGVEEFLEDSPDHVFDPIVRRSSATMGGPVALVLLDHLDLVDFYLTYVHPESPGVSERLPLQIQGGELMRVLRDQEVVCAPVSEWGVRPIEARYLSAAPLKLRDSVIGAIFFGSSERPAQEELEALRRLGAEAGVALSVADQYTDVIEVHRRRATPSIAAELQSAHLPPRALYTDRIQVTGTIEPVYDVGGDWFDYSLDPGRLFVGVCDGVGRGLSAAGISYVTLGAVRNARKSGRDLRGIMEQADRALLSSTTYEQFATLLLASIDLGTLQMDLISAAHPAPIMIPPPGAGPSQAVEPLDPVPSYPPLGAFEDVQSYTPRRYGLMPGCRVLFFSDGATERRGNSGSRLGLEGLTQYAEQSRGLARMDFLRSVMHRIKGFSRSDVEDDVTLLCVDVPPFE